MVFFDAVPKFPRKQKLHPLGTPAEGEFVKRRYPMPVKEAPDIAEQENRNDFHRDKDRILYSRAFRRMMHKTQVCFTGEMNEHLRTRLTHTFEVAQVARSIARAVGANEDLTEAIALGHDVGHTPFGHIGEYTLHNFLSHASMCTNSLSRDRAGSGRIGFKHNYQSVRLLSELDKGYLSYKGLNLTYVVLEGILKHSDLHFSGDPRDVFYEDISDVEELHLDKNFSVTLEGQIVGLADEIAQVCHDFEDALEAHFSNNRIVIDAAWQALNGDASSPGELSFLKGRYPHLNEILDAEKRCINPKYYRELTSILIGYIILTSIEKVKEEMGKYLETHPDQSGLFPLEEGIVSEENIIKHDHVYAFLKDIQKRYIIHNYEIARENRKGEFVLKKLIQAYLGDPRQLPDPVLVYYSEHCTLDSVTRVIPEISGSPKNIRYLGEKEYESLKSTIIRDELFHRVICDYISTMTDRFAIAEYQKLYGTSFGETS